MILRGSVFSKTFEMETGMTIVAPNDLKIDGNYKVAYLLHRLCGSNGDWVNYTMLPVYSNDYDIIFVMPEVARSFYTDMKHGSKYFTYITEELPSICKSIFNISAKRADTMVIGGSMGGYGALKCALSKPKQYGVCCAFSSACLFIKEDLDSTRVNEESEEFQEIQKIFGDNLEWKSDYEILELAKKVNKNSVKPKIYTACGTEDYMRESNIRFSNEMKKLDFDFTYEEWTGVHDFYFFDEALKKALKKKWLNP